MVTRFAPSPTGPLHLGHYYSAYFARMRADAHNGEMRLRIDDIDFTRCSDEFTAMIYDDLAFMGINHDGAVMVQSTRYDRYRAALEHLKDRGFVYPCTLTRKALNDLLSAPHGAQQIIRNTDTLKNTDHVDHNNVAWRLRMDAISPSIPSLSYTEFGEAEQPHTVAVDLDTLDDVVIARKDIGTSYHLSVVLDDHDSGVTMVTRGKDLEPATPIHRLLQVLLNLDETGWAHHDLITDETGKRLAKRDSSKSLQHYRDAGMNADDIRQLMKR